MPALPKIRWPKTVKGHREVKGIFVGECVLPKADRERRKGKGPAGFADEIAHCHDNGWICVPSLAVVRDNITMLHELAHLKDPNPTSRAWLDGHGAGWKNAFLALVRDYDVAMLGAASTEIKRYTFVRPRHWLPPKKKSQSKAAKRLRAIEKCVEVVRQYDPLGRPSVRSHHAMLRTSLSFAYWYDFVQAAMKEHVFTQGDMKEWARRNGKTLRLTYWPKEALPLGR